MPSEADQAIDELLERYLVLVDRYTTLRAALTTAQQHMFHALARANFTADRGVRRYGQDHYDERMQASRRVTISAATSSASSSSSAPPTFTIAEPAGEEDEDEEVGQSEEEDAEGKGKEKKKKKQQQPSVAGNPIRWFGVLVPPALREAQSQALKAVEDVIPRLVSVQAEMVHVEIEVRRARKKRAKASSDGVEKQDTASTAQTVSASS